MENNSENYKYLENKISNLSDELKEPIREIEINKHKKLFLVRNNYEGLPSQLLSHEKIGLPEEVTREIIFKMNESVNMRNFLCVDIQNFLLNVLSNRKIFKNIFGEEKQRGELEKLSNFISTPHQEEYPNLRAIKLFGFNLKSNSAPEIYSYYLILRYYQSLIEKFNKGRKDFKEFKLDKHIIKPMTDILKIINFSNYTTDEKTYLYIDKEEIKQKNIQDFLSCLQYHTFFEEYVNSKFMIDNCKKPVINPIIMLNPEKKKYFRNGIETYRLDGYIELDGTLVIKDDELILVECKNSRNITEDHLIKFCGKASLIEKMYGIKTKKFIFSTGFRWSIWKNIENYPNLKDIQIFDIDDFRNNFKRLDNFI